MPANGPTFLLVAVNFYAVIVVESGAQDRMFGCIWSLKHVFTAIDRAHVVSLLEQVVVGSNLGDLKA